jgi:hypothetical protein
MEKAELAKIERLRPRRYVLATSLTLTKDAKDKLYSILAPHVTSASDIYGLDEINALLRKHEHIVRRHLRLWLTSASVLNALLSKRIMTRSHELASQVMDTLQIYAMNGSHERALSLLEDSRVCVLAGIPGVGKTTLGHVLCAHYLSCGYELVEISEDVEEANSLWDDSVAQIFYYDDFLGQTALDEKLGKNEDGRLLSLMKRVSGSSNKRLILTTREYILAQARQRYERLDRHRQVFDMQTCVIDIACYTHRTRATILYNHVYNSQLSDELRAAFAVPSTYLPIIKHRNFNPRIIAATLAEVRLSGATDVAAEIRENLEDPRRVWDHIVNHQLKESDLYLLKIIFSFLADVSAEDLQALWIDFGYSLRELRGSLATLEGTMIKTTRHDRSVFVGLHNPSVRDYLRDYISSDPSEVLSFIKCVRTFEQIEAVWLLFPARGGGPMLEVYKRFKPELEAAATGAFRANPIRLRGQLAPYAEFARRAYFYLEMGGDLGSEVIRGLGLKEVVENSAIPHATRSLEVISILKILAEGKTPEEQAQFKGALLQAIDWIMGDTSDWDLIQEAYISLQELSDICSAVELERAIQELEDIKDSYAESALEDWAQVDHEPYHSLREMHEILDHYGQLDSAEYQMVAQRVEEAQRDMTSPVLPMRSNKSESDDGMGYSWAETRAVQQMMQTLRRDDC